MESSSIRVPSIEQIQAHIEFTENFLFAVPKGNTLDYLKLDIESPKYDVSYEQKMRRKEFNLIYFLEELQLYAGMQGGKSIIILNDIEECMFSSHFYRHLIFHENITPIISKIENLSDSVEQESRLVKRKISDKDYVSALELYKSLKAPQTKELFTHELEKLALSFKRKVLTFEGGRRS